MKKIFLFLSLLLVLNTTSVSADSWVVKHRKKRITLYKSGLVKLNICHKGKPITVTLKKWVKHKREHKDIIGSCLNFNNDKDLEKVIVEKPGDNWIIQNFNKVGSRAAIIQRAIKPNYGVAWDKMSDNTYNVFNNNKNNTIDTVINTARGIQHKFVYYKNGNMKYDISYVVFKGQPPRTYVEVNKENGRPDYTVTKQTNGLLKTNRFVYSNGRQIGILRNLIATEKETTLYNKYFKKNKL